MVQKYLTYIHGMEQQGPQLGNGRRRQGYDHGNHFCEIHHIEDTFVRIREGKLN